MGSVDLTGVSRGLFITTLIFLMLISSFLALGVLRAFQHRFREVLIYAVALIVSIILFAIVLRML